MTGLVYNGQHKEPPTQAALYFHAPQWVDRNTEAWSPTPLQCPGCQKGHLMPAGLGPEKNRQFQATTHSRTSEMQETDPRPYLHHRSQTQRDHAQPW